MLYVRIYPPTGAVWQRENAMGTILSSQVNRLQSQNSALH